MIQTIPNSGPLANDHLDGLRRDAMIATPNASLPEALTEYVAALETAYLDERREDMAKFRRESWDVRTRREPPVAARPACPQCKSNDPKVAYLIGLGGGSACRHLFHKTAQ
ncbi:MAG: hypothetical protein JOZ27_09505 [Caulobacteraceae bacterium]|nr:hypothetical protein [Caulobacteraceae bacterium]